MLFWCHYSKVHTLSVEIKAKTSRLQEVFYRLLRNISIPEKMFNQSFLSVWKSNQHTTINEKIRPLLNELDDFFMKCDSFVQNLQAAKPQHLQFDKDKMKSLGLFNISHNFTYQFDYNGVFERFKKAMPDLINSLYFKPIWSLAQLKRESQILDQYLSRADDLIMRIDTLGSIDRLILMNSTINSNKSNDTMIYWHDILVTPTIKCGQNKERNPHIWELIPTIDSPLKKSADDSLGDLQIGFYYVNEFY